MSVFEWMARRAAPLIAILAITACHPSAAGDVVRIDSLPFPSPADLVDSAADHPHWWTPMQTTLGFADAAVADEDDDDRDANDYAGHDRDGIPRYVTQLISQDDSLILRRAYGIESPHRLYVSDSSDSRSLKYDTKVKPCRSCLVNSYDVGFLSVRRPDESWEQVERRVRLTPHRRFKGSRVPQSYSIEDLDPAVRDVVEQMLADARRLGFRTRIMATYRSPRRQAFLMSIGDGRTHTLTSSHSYGRALDIIIDDGNRSHKRTRANWIAFRRWLVDYRGPKGERFRILGRPDGSWDWPHVEVRSEGTGFRSIEEAIARGRACLRPGSTVSCDFRPNLPDRLVK